MPILGELRIKDFLIKTQGEVAGRQVSDGKNRLYRAAYTWEDAQDDLIHIKRAGSSESAALPAVLPLDEALISFFGLYSGDGAKGSEDTGEPGRLRTAISFSQREPNLVRFAVEQFKRIFPKARFTFSLGEDSAYFMDGAGFEALKAYYGGALPAAQQLALIRPETSEADQRYLAEFRHAQANVENDLAFFYQHKNAMEAILTKEKRRDVISAGIVLGDDDRVTASLRRPFKKGARVPGGSSRSDETHVGNVSGMGELFLKMMHEIEETVLEDRQTSSQGLIHWNGIPSQVGELLDLKTFFSTHPYGSLAGKRPASISDDASTVYLQGLWRASKLVRLAKTLRITPLWCYTAGLYLAEGRSPKNLLFAMYSRSTSGTSLGFTSSENTSLELIIRALQNLFPPEDCVETWKVKVGSQYFPELVVVGLKNTVPMLRGGKSGDGKMRTMEISLAIKEWALEVTPVMQEYADKYSHVEPTGAGVPRIDFTASSALCKWYFPLIMYAVFGQNIADPTNGFLV